MVPSISLLLKEHPDKILFQGEKYNIHSEEVFCTTSVVYNIKSKRPACIASMKGGTSIGSTWVHKSDDNEIEQVLNKYFWEGLPWHSDIMETLHKNGLVEGTMDRHGMLLSGRCWEVNTGPRQFAVIASFWQGHNKVKSQLDFVKTLFKLMNKDITKSFFEFPNKDGAFLTYNEAFASLKPAPSLDKKTEKILQKIIHLSPEAKKSLIQMPTNKLQRAADKFGITTIELRQALGMDVAETLDIDRNIKPERSYHLYNLNLDTKPPANHRTAMWINEDPDNLYFSDEASEDEDELNWADKSVVCVFSIFKSNVSNKKMYVSWSKYASSPYNIIAYPMDFEKEAMNLMNGYESNTDRNNIWKNRITKKFKSGDIVNHLNILTIPVHTGHAEVSHRYDKSVDAGVKGIHGRVWLREGILYASFWNTLAEVKGDYRYLKSIFDRSKLDMSECMFEFIDHQGLMNNIEAFSTTPSNKPKRGEDLIKKLMAKQHTDPNAKKVLAQMQALPVNRLTGAADKLGVAPIKLYQMIHAGD